jgi:hypothetical protein
VVNVKIIESSPAGFAARDDHLIWHGFCVVMAGFYAVLLLTGRHGGSAHDVVGLLVGAVMCLALLFIVPRCEELFIEPESGVVTVRRRYWFIRTHASTFSIAAIARVGLDKISDPDGDSFHVVLVVGADRIKLTRTLMPEAEAEALRTAIENWLRDHAQLNHRKRETTP